MIGVIVAVSVVSTLLVSAVVVGAVKLYQLNKRQAKLEENMNTLGECFLTYIQHPERVDIVKDIRDTKNGFSFPNNEGF